MADADRPDIPDPDGCALLRRHDDLLDIAQRLDEAEPADRDPVVALGDVPASGVGVVVRHGVEHLLQGQVVGAQPGRVDRDLVLLGAAAPGHHVGDARNLLVLALEHPVLERLQLDERQALRFEGVPVDLADDAGQGAELGFGVGRQLGLREAFLGLLARPVIVRAVGKEHADVGEPEQRVRAQERDVGDPVQLVLEGDRDEPLDLLGRMAGPECDHLDFHVADVGVGLDGEARVGDNATGREQEGQRQRDESLMQREGDDATDHLTAFFRRMPPALTTRSAGVTPSSTSTEPSTSTPSLTDRRS